MTDEQIIKVLDCCAHDDDCANCSIKNNYSYCMETMAPYALDLINRQKRELAALYKINKRSEEEISEKNGELAKNQNLEESFLKTMKQFDKRLAKTVKLERAEAIKEFAKRLKKCLHTDDFGTPDERWKPESEFSLIIDELIKEIFNEKI